MGMQMLSDPQIQERIESSSPFKSCESIYPRDIFNHFIRSAVARRKKMQSWIYTSGITRKVTSFS